MPELDLDGAVGALQCVDRAQLGVDSGLASLGALAGAAPAAVVPTAAGGGHEGQHGQQAGEQGGSLHAGHPFTAPAVSPRTRWRWNTMRTSAMGRAAMRVPAITRLSSSTLVEFRLFSPIWIVRTVGRSVTSRGQRYSFQAFRKLKTARPAMAGRARGMATCHMNPQCP